MSTPAWPSLLAEGASHVFKIFGLQPLLLRLKDFLLYGGRQSRGEMIASAAKTTRELAEVEILRVKRLGDLVEVLKLAGFSDEKIQAVVEGEMEAGSLANDFSRLIDQIDKGNVAVVFVPAHGVPEGIKVGTALGFDRSK